MAERRTLSTPRLHQHPCSDWETKHTALSSHTVELEDNYAIAFQLAFCLERSKELYIFYSMPSHTALPFPSFLLQCYTAYSNAKLLPPDLFCIDTPILCHEPTSAALNHAPITQQKSRIKGNLPSTEEFIRLLPLRPRRFLQLLVC